MHEDVGQRIMKLGERIQYLLETYWLEASEIASPFMQEVAEIRKEIASYGYLVQWNGSLSPETGEFAVVVEIFKPRQNLSPDLQKLYDEWFLKANLSKPKGGTP